MMTMLLISFACVVFAKNPGECCILSNFWGSSDCHKCKFGHEDSLGNIASGCGWANAAILGGVRYGQCKSPQDSSGSAAEGSCCIHSGPTWGAASCQEDCPYGYTNEVGSVTTGCGWLNSLSWMSATAVGMCSEKPPLEGMNDAYLTSVLMQVALHKQDHFLSGEFNDRETWNQYDRVLREYGYNLQSNNIANFNAFKADEATTFGEDGLVVVYFFANHGGNNELVIGFPGSRSTHDFAYTNLLLALSGAADIAEFVAGGETFYAGRTVVEHYQTVRERFLRQIDDILKKSCVRSCVDVIRVLGHSLGGTAAQFGAIDMAKRYAGKYKTWLSTYASPRAFHPASQNKVHDLLTRNGNKANRFMLYGDIVPWGGVGLKHVGDAYFIEMGEGVLLKKDRDYMPDDTQALICCTTCKATDNPVTMLAVTLPLVPPTATACFMGNHFMSIYAYEIRLIRNNNRRYLEGQRRVPARSVTRRCSAFQPTCGDNTLDNIVEENAPGVGGWGGSCTCPDGSVYQVGDNFDSCGSLACVGGVSGTCNRRHGEWSRRKVTCGAQSAPKGMTFKGNGFCTSGYYAGWDGKGIGSQESCNQVCLTEPQCTYAAFYAGRTCSRYRGDSCTLNSDSDHITYAKQSGVDNTRSGRRRLKN